MPSRCRETCVPSPQHIERKYRMDDSAAFNKAAEKIGRFLPAGAYTGFQYIAAQITTDGTCDQTQVSLKLYLMSMVTTVESA